MGSDSLSTYLMVALLLLVAGVYGIVQKRSFIGMLISIELMLNGAGLNFMAFNRFLTPDPAVGQILTLMVMGIAAAEAAIRIQYSVDRREKREKETRRTIWKQHGFEPAAQS